MADHQCTWLKAPRRNARHTQDSLASDLNSKYGCSGRKIRSWENCEAGRCNEIPFTELAKILNIDADKLEQSFLEDEALCLANRVARNDSVDASLIESALIQCIDKQFKDEIIKRCNSSSITESVQKLLNGLKTKICLS